MRAVQKTEVAKSTLAEDRGNVMGPGRARLRARAEWPAQEKLRSETETPNWVMSTASMEKQLPSLVKPSANAAGAA